MDPEKEYQFKDIIGRDAKDFSEKVRFFNDQSMIPYRPYILRPRDRIYSVFIVTHRII